MDIEDLPWTGEGDYHLLNACVTGLVLSFTCFIYSPVIYQEKEKVFIKFHWLLETVV